MHNGAARAPQVELPMRRAPQRPDEVTLTLTAGRSNEATLTLRMGVPVEAFSVGSNAQWSISGPGVAPLHFFLSFDGRNVLAAAAIGSPPVMIGPTRLAAEWTSLPPTCEIQFGEVGIALRSAGFSREGNDDARPVSGHAISESADEGEFRAYDGEAADEGKTLVARERAPVQLPVPVRAPAFGRAAAPVRAPAAGRPLTHVRAPARVESERPRSAPARDPMQALPRPKTAPAGIASKAKHEEPSGSGQRPREKCEAIDAAAGAVDVNQFLALDEDGPPNGYADATALNPLADAPDVVDARRNAEAAKALAKTGARASSPAPRHAEVASNRSHSTAPRQRQGEMAKSGAGATVPGRSKSRSKAKESARADDAKGGSAPSSLRKFVMILVPLAALAVAARMLPVRRWVGEAASPAPASSVASVGSGAAAQTGARARATAVPGKAAATAGANAAEHVGGSAKAAGETASAAEPAGMSAVETAARARAFDDSQANGKTLARRATDAVASGAYIEAAYFYDRLAKASAGAEVEIYRESARIARRKGAPAAQ
jgi:hypothetical protein